MRAVEYSVRQAWASLRRSGAPGILAVLPISLALVVFGVVLVATSNAERVLAQWAAAAEFSVYLDDDATSEQRGAIEMLIDSSGVSERREYVSKAEALARFRREYAELAPLAADLDENPFPASLEVRVRPEAEADGRVEALVQRLVAVPGVADIRYDREWIARVGRVLGAARAVGFVLVALMAAVAAVTVAAVVRLSLDARRDELEIMELVGAPLSFIRGPFVVEGLMQGGCGAVLALAILWVGWMGLDAWWGNALARLTGGMALEFLPWGVVAGMLAGGMAVGAAGGYAAARHARATLPPPA
jgi:cell division transport system permease protein